MGAVLNILQLVIVLLCFLLSIFEALSAFIIFCIEIFIFVQVMSIPIFQNNQNDLYISSILMLVSSFMLCLSYILEWSIKSSKIVHALRNISNLFFSAAAIYHLIVMKKTNKAEILSNVLATWGTSDYGENFENKYKCTSVTDCMPEIEKSFKKVFDTGRGIKTPLGFFWASIIFYGILSVFLLISSKYIFNM
ncbi:hypothetical protein TRFO_24254 [Tritrichomonas foetus]|uniref:Uncharacterized protein n=1 Tax=Tritrichomonas foetus TaxID=1144522 RepID=A0A1J4KCT0_9EUKA|nr:hypothetical protein TRFO_24254 [Tritrichomonas foetus]|eukprot:OHT07508.1 hypothetical protein TRFO_24254 [Tritrichomonas foetus]